MKLNEQQIPPGSRTSRKRLGRGIGSGLGKTSGRGHKGLKARAGGRPAPLREGGQMPLYRRLPKRGFKNFLFRRKVAVVNLQDLARLEDVTEVNPETLLVARLIRPPFDLVKVLAQGELARPLTIQAHLFSKAALDKIAAAGGRAEVIGS